MKADYGDILALSPVPPTWYDTNGTPRFCEPHPDDSPNIYAQEVVFMRIACQGCREEFLVEMNWSHMDDILAGEYEKDRFRFSKHLDGLHYGDPPRHGGHGCAAGDTMNSIPLRVEQFWHRPTHTEWVRVPEYERDIK